MIFQWLLNQEMSPHDQFLLALYDHRLFSPRQFCVLAQWEVPKLRKVIHRIRMRAKKNEQWIHTVFKPSHLDSSYYLLGMDGLRYCGWMVNERVRRKQVKKTTAQYGHILGLNEILVRLIQAGVDRNHMIFLSTKEASNYLYRLCRLQDPKVNIREMIRPDGWIIFENQAYWLEYDAGTEGPLVIETKMSRYIRTLSPLRKRWLSQQGQWRKGVDRSEIMWITHTPERRGYLERIWKQLVSMQEGDEEGIKMHFFHAGDETPFLLQS